MKAGIDTGSQEIGMNSLAGMQFNVLFINGQKLRMTANEVAQILFHRFTIAFYLVTILIIIAIRPHDQTEELYGTAFVLIYFGIYLTSFFNFAILLISIAWVARRLGGETVVLTLVQFLATFLNTWLASIAIAAAGGEMISRQEMLLQWLMNGIIFEMTLTGFGLLLLPRMLHDMRAGDQATGDTAVAERMEQQLPAIESRPSHLGQWMPELSANTSEILRAEAQQNYVLIFTPGQRRLVRMSFQNFVGLMPGHLGLRVHRSHWIAKTSIRDFVARDGKIFALLTDGSLIPVSRQYQLDVLPEG